MKLGQFVDSVRVGITIVATFAALSCTAAEPPKVGEKAPDFTLETLAGEPVRLSDLASKEQVVLLVLRGWPGYQCPLCTAQVQDYLGAADELSKRSRVVMVYPGPADNLKAHAAEFVRGKEWPRRFTLLVDPDYTMIKAYGLRWDAPRETAYPSTFVLDRDRVVRFAKISHSHGDRTKAAEILKQLRPE